MVNPVLLLEDEPTILANAAMALEDAGYTVISCTYYTAALDELAAHRPNTIAAILSDYDLGRNQPSGIDFYKMVRANVSHTIPFIGVSSTMEYWNALKETADDANLHPLPKNSGTPEVYAAKLRELGINP